MRKLLLALSACVLCAAPLKAQAALSTESPATPAAPALAEAKHAPAPSLYPTTDEVRQQVAATERQKAQSEKVVPSQDWLYLVAAIIVGVVIAALVLN
jgi:hypothetical protein